MLRVAVLSMTLSILASSVAWSQEPSTREEADRQRREQQAKEVKPYEPNRVERALDFAEDKAIFILDREGFHPKFGSLTTGSGFAYGLGFRDRDLFSNTGALEILAAGSVKRYWATEARLTFPRLARNHLYLETWASHRDYPQENFFGLGPDSARDDRVRLRDPHEPFRWPRGCQTRRAPARRRRARVPDAATRRGAERSVSDRDRGHSLRPKCPALFPAPISCDPTRSSRSTIASRDIRRKGGWYRIDFSHYDDRTAGQFTFNRIDADLRQFIGFLAGRRVIAARLFVSTSDTSAGQTMPFYFMPTLGGNDTLRGFREYRFRAPHAILAQAEYRWEIWSGFDAALFYDAGKVANRRDDLDFENLESDYGIGFRFNTNSGVILRVDAAFGSRDGKHLYIVFGGVF